MRVMLAAAISLFAGAASADGTYTHTASAMRCPSGVAGYAFQSLSGPADPDCEGVCTYTKGGPGPVVDVVQTYPYCGGPTEVDWRSGRDSRC